METYNQKITMYYDESILYECYIQMELVAEKMLPNTVPIKEDIKAINSIICVVNKLLNAFEGKNVLINGGIKKNLTVAKTAYCQYLQIKSRNPELISDTLSSKVDRFIQYISGYEAFQLASYRKQNKAAQSIDLRRVFEIGANLHSLKSKPALNIVKETLQVKQIRGFLDDTAYCVTNTGKKYHNPRCPYCNGKETHEITLEQIKIREIDPCICVTRGFGANTKRPAIDSTYMTAYVDESWRPVEWDENGNKGHVGNYSYVIYKGRVEEDEDHISLSDAMILCKGVDYCAINKGHIEFLTEAAIGKVLIRLLYDYGFKKNVIIYTDNKSVVYAWNRSYENSELARQFETVEVRHIPRGQNRHADHLGRKQVFLCLPSDKYKEIVNTCKAVDCGGVIA